MSAYIRLIKVFSFMVMVCALASADNITLYYPSDGDNCVIGDTINISYIPNVPVNNCNLYTNTSGVWTLTDSSFSVFNLSMNYFYESPSVATYLWQIQCSNTTHTLYSKNRTFTYKDVAYCAVLSAATCTSTPNVGSKGVLNSRLSNTRGVYLENQDCSVYITRDSDNAPVVVYDTMLYNAETNVQLDNLGNWINIVNKKAPLTDSGGNYVFSYDIDSSWAWVGDNYTDRKSVV
jgi:hypothetical protein